MNKIYSTHSSIIDERNENIKIYVNGEILHRKEAKISVYDSGFMLGDGMWEGMRLVQGIWIFFEEHMDRLFSSCHAVGIDIGLDRDGILKVLNDTANANNITTDAHCRLMVTRGIKDKPFQHPNLSNSGSSIVIIIEHSKPDINLKSEGISLATVPQIRGLPMSQDPKYNSHSKLNCVLACLQAEQAGAQEGLMLDPHGFINTTNACNFFIVLDNEVWTSTGDYCMKGITRQKIIDICYKNNININIKNFSLVETYKASEAFLTGTFGGLTPVSSIDKKIIGTKKGLGPLSLKLQELYDNTLEIYVKERIK